VPQPEDLYSLHAQPQRPAGASDASAPLVLVVGMTGFLDAGGAPTSAAEHLLDQLDHRLLATFDSDALLDYRTHRPVMTYVRDHYDTAVVPEIRLYQMADVQGRAFLLLVGPEPDFAWNAFIEAVTQLVESFGVSLVVGLGAVPWPAPHTRPLDVSAHATDPQRVAGYRAWVSSIQIPGHVGGLLELRLGESGHEAMGFAVHVPQYLAQYGYPRAAVRLLEAVDDATGLSLPIATLAEAARVVDEEIVEHLARSSELAEGVRLLEVRYDAGHDAGHDAGSLDELAVDGELPSGDDIAASLERYLAERAASDE
jgi:predicted ATP-grasp superfamily ATP-dependent carboligase